ncbi:MAG: hypothetical protein H6719_06390 [Sandaracinaceae bacterium]|nr:hypothetical protein [Sandaracinaceae bacterium]
MIARSICCCVLLLAGCGAPAIVDASRTLATGHDCEPARLTVAESGGAYGVSGCGADGVYSCEPGAECSASSESVDMAWVAEGRAAMAAIADEVLACNDGQAFTLQVRLDTAGQPQGLASDPELGGDQRVCVGRIVLDHVALSEASGERLLAYEFGGAAPPAALPVAEEPVAEEPVEEPIEEPSDDVAEPAPPEGDEGTDVPDDLIE